MSMIVEDRKPNYQILNQKQEECVKAVMHGGSGILPTGCGKSHCIGRHAAALVLTNVPLTWIVSPSHIVQAQNQVAFKQYSGRSPHIRNIEWFTYQSFLSKWEQLLTKRVPKSRWPRYVIIDEYHHANDVTGLVGKEVILNMQRQGVKFVYYSATNWDKEVRELWGSASYTINYSEAVEHDWCANLAIVSKPFYEKKSIVFVNRVEDIPLNNFGVSKVFRAYGDDRERAEQQTKQWERTSDGLLIAIGRLGEGYSPPNDMYGVHLPDVVNLPTRAMQLAGRAARCKGKIGYIFAPSGARNALKQAEMFSGANWIWS